MPEPMVRQRGRQLPPGVKEIPVVGLLDHGLAYEHRPPEWPWIMVPAGETRALVLGPASMASLPTPKTSNGLPFRLTNVDSQGQLSGGWGPLYAARISGNQLFITGRGPISAAPLDLYQPGAQLRIWVTVKPRRTLPIIAHYVEHGPILKARTTPDDLRQIIDFANRILVRQTNIHLQVAVQSVLSHERIGKGLGAVIRYDPKNPDPNDEWNLITKHKIAIPAKKNELEALNVFLVREVNRKGKNNELGATSSGCCILEDRVSGGIHNVQRGGRILAHEVGHHLRQLANRRDALDLGTGAASGGDPGRFDRLLANFLAADDHQRGDPKNLMYPTDQGGERLNRGQIEMFNPTQSYQAWDPRWGAA